MPSYTKLSLREENNPVQQGFLGADKKMQEVVNNAGRCLTSSMINEKQTDKQFVLPIRKYLWGSRAPLCDLLPNTVLHMAMERE